MTNPRISIATTFVLCLLLSNVTHGIATAQETGKEISLEQKDDRIVVWIGSGEGRQSFTEYRFKEYAKPILYPVYAPGNVAITRHYPMEAGHEAESKDHPHHKSIWFAHGDVSGLDYWSEKHKIRHKSIEKIDGNLVVAKNEWMNDDESTSVCIETTKLRFSAADNWRKIDYGVTIYATSNISFGDTKEGTFGIRTHPALRIVDRNKQPAGEAFNSEAIEGVAIWGKNARWVHYRGKIDGQTYSITVMDHPASWGSPTTWHAREYGLVAANPFGLSHFKKLEAGTGTLNIMHGEEKHFRYGVLIHRGEITADQINEHYERFAKE